MSLLLRYLPHLLALGLAFGLGTWAGYSPGAAKAAKAERAMAMMQRDAAQQIALAEQMAREAEHRHADDMARIGQEHQEALTHAKAQSEALADSLRAGTVRLRERWRSCAAANVSGTSPSAGGAAEEAGLQAASVGRIDRAVAECEAHVLGLQAITSADRAKTGD